MTFRKWVHLWQLHGTSPVSTLLSASQSDIPSFLPFVKHLVPTPITQLSQSPGSENGISFYLCLQFLRDSWRGQGVKNRKGGHRIPVAVTPPTQTCLADINPFDKMEDLTWLLNKGQMCMQGTVYCEGSESTWGYRMLKTSKHCELLDFGTFKAAQVVLGPWESQSELVPCMGCLAKPVGNTYHTPFCAASIGGPEEKKHLVLFTQRPCQGKKKTKARDQSTE